MVLKIKRRERLARLNKMSRLTTIMRKGRTGPYMRRNRRKKLKSIRTCLLPKQKWMKKNQTLIDDELVSRPTTYRIYI